MPPGRYKTWNILADLSYDSFKQYNFAVSITFYYYLFKLQYKLNGTKMFMTFEKEEKSIE